MDQCYRKLTTGQVIAIDGKPWRRSHDHDTGKTAIYKVSAWATTIQVVLGQRKVDGKSNEITAIPELLALLAIAGCIVIIDAIGTQTEIAQTIVDSGTDYVLSVMENQGNLFDNIQYLFEVDATQGFAQISHSYAQKINKGHCRLETRECWVIDD